VLQCSRKHTTDVTQLLFYNTFLSTKLATSINIHVPLSLSQIMVTGLLLGTVLSVCTCWSQYGYRSFTTCFDCFWHSNISVRFLILPALPCICYSVFEHTLYRVLYVNVLLPILAMLIRRVLLSHQIVYRVCICYMFLFVMFLSHDIWFVMPDLCYHYFTVSLSFQISPRQK
jgi:hypothetical protein